MFKLQGTWERERERERQRERGRKNSNTGWNSYKTRKASLLTSCKQSAGSKTNLHASKVCFWLRYKHPLPPTTLLFLLLLLLPLCVFLVILILFPSHRYCLITRLIIFFKYSLYVCFVLYVFSILCILCFCIVLCIVSPLVYSRLFYQFCTNLPTAAAGWEPNRI